MSKKKTIKELLTGNPYVKDTWADFAESSLKPKYYLNRYDDNKGNRFYYFKYGEETIIAAGSTTVFGMVSVERDRIMDWKMDNPNWKQLLNISSEYGTLSHAVKSDILFHKEIDKAKLEAMEKLIRQNDGNFNTPTKDIFSFMKFQEDYQLTPLLIEASLVWQDPESGEWLAQTIDLLARMTVTIKTKTRTEDGIYQRGANAGQVRYKDVTTEEKAEKILLVDFKSNFFEKEKKGFYETHKLQLQAAKLAVEQNFPELKVDDIYNFSENNWRTEPSYTFYKWDLDQKDWDIFYTYWKLARLKGINKPQGKMLITDGFKDSSDFKYLTYEEYVNQILLKDGKENTN